VARGSAFALVRDISGRRQGPGLAPYVSIKKRIVLPYTSSSRKFITIERHILDEQQSHPEATGAFTGLLYDFALGGKVIADEMNRAGLAEILGRAGQTNVQGEEVMKVDLIADDVIRRLNDHTRRLAIYPLAAR
jgi:Fructose-1-6-bisphosphatase, N-terminal domain